MKSLVLYFSESSLQLIQVGSEKPLLRSIPIDMGKPFARDYITEAIKEVLIDHQLEKILWFGADYTLFPLDLFDPNNLNSYYELNQGPIPANCTLTYQILEKAGIVIIFSVPIWLYDYAKYELQTTQLNHVVLMPLIQSFYQLNGNLVTIIIENQHFVLTVLKEGKLQSITTNDYQQNPDILYFLLAQQQKIKLAQPVELHIFDATDLFDSDAFGALLKQFKDFENYQINFHSCSTYQNQILCASLEVH